jgi:hypothetical protein
MTDLRLKFIAVVGLATPHNSLPDDAPFIVGADKERIERRQVEFIDIFRKRGSRQDMQRSLVYPITFEPCAAGD